MNDLFDSIRKSWDVETCYPPLQHKWSPHLPELGQCAVTALLIQERLGGIIVFNKKYHHYWNILPEAGEIDLTRKQFEGVDVMRIDGYKEIDYFIKNDDTYSRFVLLRTKVTRYEMYSL